MRALLPAAAVFAAIGSSCGASENEESTAISATETSSDTSGDTTHTSGGSTSTGASSSATDGATTGPAVECPTVALAPGDYDRTLEHDGIVREYALHVPPSYDGSSARPLVFDFHPWMTNANYQIGASRMRDKADDNGFLVVHAEGIGGSWNGGPECCSPANSDGLDDVGFARAMVTAISDEACVDPSRIYATGYSNGGYLSHRLACEASDVFAAVAPVAARMGIAYATCTPERAVPVLAINGTADNLVPYAQAVESMERWAAIGGCGDTQDQTWANGAVHCDSWTRCDAGIEVTLCTVDGGGHCWFGQQTCYTGPNSSDISATDAVWQFFEHHSL